MTRFPWDTKIAVIVRDDLEAWQRINVTAFIISGIVHSHPDTIGAPYEYADAVTSAPLLRQPVFVFEAPRDKLPTIAGRARRRQVTFALYPESIFATDNDDDNRATVRSLAFDDVTIAGIAVHGPAADVDRVIKGAAVRHP